MSIKIDSAMHPFIRKQLEQEYQSAVFEFWKNPSACNWTILEKAMLYWQQFEVERHSDYYSTNVSTVEEFKRTVDFSTK